MSAINEQMFIFVHRTEHNSLLLFYCFCMSPVWRFEPRSVARPWLWWSSSHNFHTEPQLYGYDSLLSKQTTSEPLNRKTRLFNWCVSLTMTLIWTLSSSETDLCIVRSSTWTFPHCRWTKYQPHTLVTEIEGSRPLISKSAIGYNPEPGPPISYQHNIFS